MLKDIFSWFNEDKLLKKFRALNKHAEQIASELDAAIANEQITVFDLQKIREGAAMARVTLGALLDAINLHESQLAAVVGREQESIEILKDTKGHLVQYVDRVNDAAQMAGNATDALLSTPEAAAKMLASFNPKVLKTACDILADNEDWQTLGILHDIIKKKLDGQ